MLRSNRASERAAVKSVEEVAECSTQASGSMRVSISDAPLDLALVGLTQGHSGCPITALTPLEAASTVISVQASNIQPITVNDLHYYDLSFLEASNNSFTCNSSLITHNVTIRRSSIHPHPTLGEGKALPNRR
jgi:hypothetical protein